MHVKTCDVKTLYFKTCEFELNYSFNLRSEIYAYLI